MEMMGWELDDPWGLRSHFRGLLLIPRSEKSRELGGHSEKVYEKRPYIVRFGWTMQGLFFLTFERHFRD